MNYLKINIKFIKILTGSNQLSLFYYFLKFKYTYSNSVHYNFTVYKLAKACKVSHKVAKSKINQMVAIGWCTKQGAHLKFISMSSLYAAAGLSIRGCRAERFELSNKTQSILTFRKILLEDNIRKQQFIIAVKQDLINPTTTDAYKKARKKAKALGLEPGEIADDTMISVSGLATLFNCSMTNAHRIKKQFQSELWFTFTKQISLLAAQVTKRAFKKYFNPYFTKSTFYFKGAVYQSKPSFVSIMDPYYMGKR